MVVKKHINEKVVEIEILDRSEDILDKKIQLLYGKVDEEEVEDIIKKVRNKIINLSLTIKVIRGARLVYLYDELHYANKLSELLEVLLIHFKNQQEYEICELIVEVLTNKKY